MPAGKEILTLSCLFDGVPMEVVKQKGIFYGQAGRKR